MRYFMRARRRVRRSKPSHGRSQQMVACPAPACKDSTAASGHLSNAIFSPALMVDCARQQRATTRLPKNAPDGLDQRRRALLCTGARAGAACQASSSSLVDEVEF
eukprot:TRINITY_DN20536_c0_g1_i1.p3 TRINITY_DN20536_c0_g1~~TRINITY_DN20536_c0_g1_i1.p3  ORF type:complete len:105 (+),score=5.28 TRINITY_DN20536_c0_g1_i1:184-498(+)